MYTIQESLKLDDIHSAFSCEDWEPVDNFCSQHKDILNRLYYLSSLDNRKYINYDSVEERLDVLISSTQEHYEIDCQLFETDQPLLKIIVKVL
jgi:hypothetical protein